MKNFLGEYFKEKLLISYFNNSIVKQEIYKKYELSNSKLECFNNETSSLIIYLKEVKGYCIEQDERQLIITLADDSEIIIEC